MLFHFPFSHVLEAVLHCFEMQIDEYLIMKVKLIDCKQLLY